MHMHREIIWFLRIYQIFTNVIIIIIIIFMNVIEQLIPTPLLAGCFRFLTHSLCESWERKYRRVKGLLDRANVLPFVIVMSRNNRKWHPLSLFSCRPLRRRGCASYQNKTASMAFGSIVRPWNIDEVTDAYCDIRRFVYII